MAWKKGRRSCGQIEKIGIAPALKVSDAAGKTVLERTWPADGFDHDAATREILTAGRDLLGEQKVEAFGHRVVHAGCTLHRRCG